MFKKFKAYLLVVLALSSLLFVTACSNGDESADGGEPSGEITVGIWGTPTEIEFYTQAAEDFTEETGIEVTLKQYTDFQTEIQAELIGGTAPDVFYVEAYMLPFFASQGVLAPVEDNVDTSVFIENVNSAFFYDETQYAVPKDYSTLSLYYNTAYVDPATIPATMEEFPEYLAELQKTLPEGVVPMTYQVDLARNMWVAESGGLSVTDEEGYATLTSPEMVENLSIIYDAAAQGLVYTNSDIGFGWNGESFGNQKTAMMIEGNWVAAELENNYPDVEYGVIEIPTFNGEQGSMLFTVGWGVNAASDNQEAAWEYVNYMTSYDMSKEIFEATGVLPARTDASEDLGLDADPIFGPHYASASYATVWQKGTTMSTINSEYMNYMTMVASGEKSLEETLALVETEANKIIAENLE